MPSPINAWEDSEYSFFFKNKASDVKLELDRRHLSDSTSKEEIYFAGAVADHIDDIGLLTPTSIDSPLVSYPDLWKNDMEQSLVEFCEYPVLLPLDAFMRRF